MTVEHILADGTQVESIEGHTVSIDHVEFYHAINRLMEELQNGCQNK